MFILATDGCYRADILLTQMTWCMALVLNLMHHIVMNDHKLLAVQNDAITIYGQDDVNRTEAT